MCTWVVGLGGVCRLHDDGWTGEEREGREDYVSVFQMGTWMTRAMGIMGE